MQRVHDQRRGPRWPRDGRTRRKIRFPGSHDGKHATSATAENKPRCNRLRKTQDCKNLNGVESVVLRSTERGLRREAPHPPSPCRIPLECDAENRTVLSMSSVNECTPVARRLARGVNAIHPVLSFLNYPFVASALPPPVPPQLCPNSQPPPSHESHGSHGSHGSRSTPATLGNPRMSD